MSINCNFLIHIISMIFGTAIGIGVSFIVNCTLIEISIDRFFAYVSFFKEVFFCILCNYRNIYIYTFFEKLTN